MIDFTPDPVFFRILGIPIYWYGVAYAVGLAVVYWVVIREARFRGLDETIVGTGMIVIAVAALIGGRLYHVIDQWHLYEAHPITAILPIAIQPDGSYAFAGFTGLGVPGGIVTGTIAGYLFVRWKRQSFPMWADVVAPGLFVMQAIGRWGNFFNQELYGPPTDLPWGIKIDCLHRIVDYPCATYPEATTHFQPLFLYESISGIIGALVLIYLARRWSHKLISGDLLLIFLVWYGTTRFLLENLRRDNWTFFGIPTAQLVTLGFIVVGLVGLWYRHGPGRPAETAADLLPDHGHRPTAEDDEAAFWEDAPDGELADGADEEDAGDIDEVEAEDADDAETDADDAEADGDADTDEPASEEHRDDDADEPTRPTG